MYANLCHASEKFFKKLIGRKDIEDSLKRLDRLTQEEARMAAAQILSLTHTVDNNVTDVGNKVTDVGKTLKVVDDKMDVVVKGKPRVEHSFANPDCTNVV
jgi:phenylalanyl-tRNA synthetase alpha subunit